MALKQRQGYALPTFPLEQKSQGFDSAQNHSNLESPASKQESQFSKRFICYQFENEKDHKKYIYEGRQSQKYYPFFVRFQVSQKNGLQQKKEQNKQQKLQYSMTIKKILNFIVDDSKNISKLHTLSDELKNNQQRKTKYYHGYLLTGIAKSNITVNEVFDSLFLSFYDNTKLFQRKIKNKEMVYWEQKRQSYEYFKFICKAYAELRNYLQLSILKEKQQRYKKIEKLANEQTNKKQQNVDKINQIKQKQTQDQKQKLDSYLQQQIFNNKNDLNYKFAIYFHLLFKDNYMDILNQLEAHEKQQNYKLMGYCNIVIRNTTFKLYKFDYREYYLRQFPPNSLSEESLNKMANNISEINNIIFKEYEYKTRAQKIKKLQKLIQSESFLFYKQIKLIPLHNIYSLKQENTDTYMILVRKQGKEITDYQLNKILWKEQSKEEDKIYDFPTPKNSNQERMSYFLSNLYNIIYKIHNKNVESPQLFQFKEAFRFSPQNISVYVQKFRLQYSFESFLIQYLSLNKLPLTYQQRLLTPTPNFDINVYQIFQNFGLNLLKLLQNFREQDFQANEKQIRNCCLQLTNDTFEFHYQAQLGLSIQNEKQIYATIYEKFFLLEIGMISYQIAHKQKCLYYQTTELIDDTENEKPIQYSKYFPAHYKQLHQYILLLLIKADIIKDITYKEKRKESKIHQKLSKNTSRIQNIIQSYQNKYVQYLKLCNDSLFNVQKTMLKLTFVQQKYIKIKNVYQKVNKIFMNKELSHERQLLKKGYIFYLDYFHKLTSFKLIQLDKLNNQHNQYQKESNLLDSKQEKYRNILISKYQNELTQIQRDFSIIKEQKSIFSTSGKQKMDHITTVCKQKYDKLKDYHNKQVVKASLIQRLKHFYQEKDLHASIKQIKEQNKKYLIDLLINLVKMVKWNHKNPEQIDLMENIFSFFLFLCENANQPDIQNEAKKQINQNEEQSWNKLGKYCKLFLNQLKEINKAQSL